MEEEKIVNVMQSKVVIYQFYVVNCPFIKIEPLNVYSKSELLVLQYITSVACNSDIDAYCDCTFAILLSKRVFFCLPLVVVSIAGTSTKVRPLFGPIC